MQPPAVGDRVGPLTVGRVAHGGHWVARMADGRVVFLRGALEGEVVSAELTAMASRHAFGRVVEVHEPSPDRVPAPCAIAAECGGCDFQHVATAVQLDLKGQVVAEQLTRLAKIGWDGAVEQVEPVVGWRTRVRYHREPGASVPEPFDPGGGWGMHPHRSHDVTPLPAEGCLIAAPGLRRPPATLAPEACEARGVEASDGVRWLTGRSDVTVTQRAAGRTWQVGAEGFWQVHPQAADTLVAAVLDALAPRPGERALDLFCGVGLFAGALADRGVRVTGVEGDADAVALARTNVPEAEFLAGDVARTLRRVRGSVDLVVLDPPRAGAGRAVIEAVLGRTPRAVAYVACDPAGLARDLGYAAAAGASVEWVRAFDLFGMTHHVECVALITPAGGRLGAS